MRIVWLASFLLTFHPKVTDISQSAGLLTRFFRSPSHRLLDSGFLDRKIEKLTATGIVPDFHRVPY